MRKILTIDVGGTFTKYAVMTGTQNFTITAKDKIPTLRKNHDDFITGLTNIFNACNDVEGIGISLPGIIDSDNGICLAAELFNFNNGRNIADELKNVCGVPVTIENDANCAALAEIKSGSLIDVKDAFVLVFGSMVGGAFIRDRKIYRGAHHCAGEVSFTLTNNSEISASDFQKLCAKILNMPTDKVTGEMIFNLIDNNNGDMLKALDKYANAVAMKIFNLQVLFDPERFALGGGISERQIFIDAVNNQLDKICDKVPKYFPRPEIVACKYHNDANLFGALYRYLNQ